VRKQPEDQSNGEWLADFTGELPQQHDTPPQERHKPAPRLVMPDDLGALIPEGWYVARCVFQRLGEYWGDPKVTFTFQIILGEYNGTKLECFYNLQKQGNEAGGFDFVPGKCSDYVRMLRRVFGGLWHKDGTAVQPQDLVSKVFNVEVETVDRDHKRGPLEKANQYSKIKTNIGIRNEERNT
jgi:hypothetical protein